MKKTLFTLLLASLAFTTSANAKTVEIDVHGMTCALCVDSLNQQFNKMSGVSNIQISIKTKKIKLVILSDEPSVELIKQAVLDAGFTPIKVTVLNDDKSTQPS